MSKVSLLRKKIIVPALLFYVLLICIVGAGIYELQRNNIEAETKEHLQSVEKVFRETINRNLQKMDIIIDQLQADPDIQTAWKTQDRNRLLALTWQRFQTLKHEQKITHLYFTGLDRRVFLRVHNPDMHGDLIERYTMMQAAHTKIRSVGLEHGILHNMTLRNVQPWFIDGELAGYIEVGEEIAYLTDEIADMTGTELFVTYDKTLFDKETWLKGVELYNLNGHWDRFENSVIVGQTLPRIPKSLERHLNLQSDQIYYDLFSVSIEGKIYHGGYVDLHSVDGTLIGKIIVLDDITQRLKETTNLLMLLIPSGTLLFALVLLAYYNYIKKIESQMQHYIEKVEFNYDFEQYLNKASNTLLLDESIDHAIDQTLSELGTTLKAHRAYLFTFSDDYSLMSNSHEWCAVDVPAEREHLQNIETANIPWWRQQCLELRPIVIENIDDLPEEAAQERQSLQAQEIRSLLVYPVAVKGVLKGFVGIDMVHYSVAWTTTHHLFLKVTAEAIANAWEKRDASQQIERSYRDVMLTLDTASNGIFVIDEAGKVRLYNQKFLDMWQLKTIPGHFTLPMLFAVLADKLKTPELCHSRMRDLLKDPEREALYTVTLTNGSVYEVHSVAQFEDGHYKGRSFSFRDITERLAWEEEVSLVSKVFEHSLEGIIITDSNTDIIRVNRAFTELTGYAEAELIGNRPTLINSSWHDTPFYKAMWRELDDKGVWEGEIYDRRKNGELYISLTTIIAVTDTAGNVKNYIGINRDITQIKEAQKSVEHLAYYDALTNLPNRVLFRDRLEQTLNDTRRHRGKAALMFIDLDNFKTVNDTLGHHSGDRLLQIVADRLVSAVRQNDTVCRLSGDEFTIIIKDAGKREDIVTVATKIIAAIRQPIVIAEHAVDVGCSIGIALFPDDADDLDTLMRHADAAMYRAKQDGKNRFEFFTKPPI